MFKKPSQFKERIPFVEVGKNKQTPAMRLGLAKSKITIEDIIYYKQNWLQLFNMNAEKDIFYRKRTAECIPAVLFLSSSTR